MRIALSLALVAFVVLPACKSRRDPQDFEQMQKRTPDAKPMLYVGQDDKRYVATGTGSRQIHYYSKSKDRTYVVDENTGKVVTAFASKEMPGVAVVETKEAPEEPTFVAEPEPGEGCGEAMEGCAPEGCAPEGCAPEGCGPGCAPEGCAPEGCAPKEGCRGGEESAEDDEGEDEDEPGDVDDEDDDEGEGEDDDEDEDDEDDD